MEESNIEKIITLFEPIRHLMNIHLYTEKNKGQYWVAGNFRLKWHNNCKFRLYAPGNYGASWWKNHFVESVNDKIYHSIDYDTNDEADEHRKLLKEILVTVVNLWHGTHK